MDLRGCKSWKEVESDPERVGFNLTLIIDHEISTCPWGCLSSECGVVQMRSVGDVAKFTGTNLIWGKILG